MDAAGRVRESDSVRPATEEVCLKMIHQSRALPIILRVRHAREARLETSPPKTLEDFPKFVVTALRRGPMSEEGYTYFELEGHFDRSIEPTQPTGPQWFWLLFAKRGCLCASVRSFDKDTKAAVLTFEAREEPDIVGHSLAYLSSYWQAFNVWMVLDPDWGWEKKQFLAADAIAEDFQSREISIVEGQEVKFWTKLSRADVWSGQSRHYSAASQVPASTGNVRLVPSGWDHEHCELCNSHIDIGRVGYCDPDERWMCESCYARYVVRRDLAFVDGI